jgi:hypothetical protein
MQAVAHGRTAMTDSDDDLTSDDLIVWLKQEVFTITKAAQLRIQDASDFVTAFLAGKLTLNEVNQRLSQYETRWGEPIPGGTAHEGMSDEEIIARLDREHSFVRREIVRRPAERGDATGREP